MRAASTSQVFGVSVFDSVTKSDGIIKTVVLLFSATHFRDHLHAPQLERRWVARHLRGRCSEFFGRLEFGFSLDNAAPASHE